MEVKLVKKLCYRCLHYGTPVLRKKKGYGDNQVTTYTKMCEMYFEQLPTIEKRLDDLVKRRDKAIKQILKNFDDVLKIIVKGK